MASPGNDEDGNRTCQICTVRPVSGINYGTLCCGACKMFFRRVLFVKNIDYCRRDGECIRKCRYCRFKKCIEAGMTYTPTENLMDINHTDSLSALIFYLSHQEDHRHFQLLNCLYQGDPTVADVALEPGPIKFQSRPEAYQMNLPEWVFISGMTSLNYLKRFNYATMLNDSDRTSLLKSTFFDFSILTNAMWSLEQNHEYLSFPDGSDIVRQGIVGATRKFLNELRCRLAGWVNDLKVTRDEFLLMALVFFCNPALPEISESGRGILNTYQKIYKSALLQHCLLTYQRNGPARFTDLLSIFQLIQKTRQDISQLFILSMINTPPCPSHKKITDHYVDV